MGNVKVTRKPLGSDNLIGNDEILLTNLGPGSLFGEMTGLKKLGRRTSTVTAENTCIVMSLKNYFLKKLNKDLITKIKDELIRTILGRFDRLEGKYVQLITSNKIEEKKQ
jgi:CRP-like cAMP-binding protein